MKLNKYVWIGGGIGLFYSLVAYFFSNFYNIDGTPLDFLMPILFVWFIAFYIFGSILGIVIGGIFVTIIFILIGSFIGFMLEKYKEIGIAIFISIILIFIGLYFFGIFVEDTAPMVWIAPLIFFICLLIGWFIRKRNRRKDENEK